MNITIKPLCAGLNEAFLDFFDNRAFSDNNPMGPCYCNAAVMTSEEIDKMVSEFGDDCKGTLRRYAAAQLAEEKIFGYLAFDGDTPIGWCNAGDMKRYPVSHHQAVPDFARDISCGSTISIVCFAIAPDCRKRGIASALLERIIADAKLQDYKAVEGYVNTEYTGEYWDHSGPARLYEKFGFKEAARKENRIIMRKELK
ncbi:MAG: GNAT family N-acetyltransferase [Clostridiales bacterium]|jgi:ribosomal protein S18 acetylase RimI-like enzyme|nr:GNAT family N-acetyltransferase [Clostridiales bacterium]